MLCAQIFTITTEIFFSGQIVRGLTGALLAASGEIKMWTKDLEANYFLYLIWIIPGVDSMCSDTVAQLWYCCGRRKRKTQQVYSLSSTEMLGVSGTSTQDVAY